MCKQAGALSVVTLLHVTRHISAERIDEALRQPHASDLLPEDEDTWLNPDMTEVEQIPSYLRPYPDELLEAVRAA